MKYLLSCLLLLGSLSLTAQSSPRKLVKQAEIAQTAGQHAKAADLYTQAWKQKQDKLEWRYRAGIAYLKSRDYARAADALSACTLMTKDHPMVQLDYARALKQNRQYQDAIPVFNAFLDSYQGKKKEKLSQWVENEVAGCQKGIQLEPYSGSILSNRLEEQINSDEQEFSPVFFTDDILYYSTVTSGQNAEILRSQRLSGDWLPAVKPDFPEMPAGHFCHGSLSPDNKRFYFTICEGGLDWQGVASACDLYVTQYNGTIWTKPVKMRDYIKMDGTTATHPNVVHLDGIEFIYFSTDRIGGKGGMDIWYTYRFLDTDDFDYALPQNAGPTINTPGDEVTPFYDVKEKTLYFSSNGHATIGGFDIFKAQGQMEDWDGLSWMPLPYNSAANDYYFTKAPGGMDQYLVSNRKTEEKSSTTDDDIFQLTSVVLNPKVSGKILANNDRKTLDQVEVSLYEIRKNADRRLLQSQISMDGNYAFDLIPGKKFRLEVFRPGYQLGFYDLDAASLQADDHFQQDFYLTAQEEAVASTNDSSIYTERTNTTSTRPTTSTNTPSSLPKLPSATRRYTPKHKGVYYKVQLSAVIHYNEEEPNLRRVAQFGRIDLEYILDKGWIRLLLADYFTLEEAQHTMKQCRMLGYPDAFIVKYLDGKRMQ